MNTPDVFNDDGETNPLYVDMLIKALKKRNAYLRATG